MEGSLNSEGEADGRRGAGAWIGFSGVAIELAGRGGGGSIGSPIVDGGRPLTSVEGKSAGEFDLAAVVPPMSTSTD